MRQNQITQTGRFYNNADGAASRMSDTMLDNLEGSITLLQSAMDGVKISFGERLSPYVRGIADWLTDQMPNIEQGLNEMMDWVDTKVDRMKRKFKEMTQSDEWQNADFFGKVKIAWDDLLQNHSANGGIVPENRKLLTLPEIWEPVSEQD